MDWFIGHLIGDYLLQNDWMAQNKKLRTWPCAIHCSIWTVSVMVCAGWYQPFVILALFVTHFIQDRTNIVVWSMRHKGQKAFASPPMSPWSIIVVDNVMHLVTVWLISKYLV